MRLYGLLGGKHIFVCKACGKLGGSRGMFPRGKFDFGPFIRPSVVSRKYNDGKVGRKQDRTRMLPRKLLPARITWMYMHTYYTTVSSTGQRSL